MNGYYRNTFVTLVV